MNAETLHPAKTLTESEKSDATHTVKNYSKRLARFIRGRVTSDSDAEDILQDVWHQFIVALDTGPIEQAGAWLYRVARGKIIDKYRKHKHISLDEHDEESDDEEFSFKEILLLEKRTPESELLKNAFWDQLFSALNELPEEQRQVFVWHELEELSFNEIAEKTGASVNTLLSRKRYAVLHLRKRLHEFYNDIF